MATVSVILKTHRVKNDGSFPICIRVTEGNKTRYKYIGYSVKRDQFKTGLCDWVRKHPDALFINSIIEDQRSEIQEKITRLKLDRRDFSFEYILSDSPADGHCISEILMIIADRNIKQEAITNAYRHISIKNQVIDCFGSDVLLKNITFEDVRKIEYYFQNTVKNKSNTVSKKIKILRSAFTEAKRLWKGELGDNPFEMLQLKSEPINRIKLNHDHIKAIENLHLVGLMDISRDAFLFAYYAQGMRFKSVVMMTRTQILEDGIRYQMLKGNHHRIIGRHPKIDRIIDKYKDGNSPYLFPIIKSLCKTKTQAHYAVDSANTIVNTCLERIGILIGLEVKLTFHISKHSYAQMLKKSGVDPWIIKDSLGHTDFRTTEAYLKSLDDDHINKAVTGLY